ncbi:hypothetical protein BGZ49_006627, partial [Haplosporangium sp. Z 27]
KVDTDKRRKNPNHLSYSKPDKNGKLFKCVNTVILRTLSKILSTPRRETMIHSESLPPCSARVLTTIPYGMYVELSSWKDFLKT